MAIDDQLLQRNKGNKSVDSEAETAGNFREERRFANFSNEQEEGKSLRELKKSQMARSQGTEKSSTGIKGKIAEKMSPFLAMTDNLLKSAWTNLLPSWGLTLLWIDIHAFLNKVFGPTAFRELGEEWVPASIKKLGEQKSKEVAGLLRISEKAGCGCLNLGCLFAVIAILATFSIVVSAIASPFSTLYNYLLSDSSLGSLINLIKGWW